MAAAMLDCQQFKRAKAKKGEGKKRVKLSPEENARRKVERRMQSEANRINFQNYLQKEQPGE